MRCNVIHEGGCVPALVCTPPRERGRGVYRVDHVQSLASPHVLAILALLDASPRICPMHLLQSHAHAQRSSPRKAGSLHPCSAPGADTHAHCSSAIWSIPRRPRRRTAAADAWQGSCSAIVIGTAIRARRSAATNDRGRAAKRPDSLHDLQPMGPGISGYTGQMASWPLAIGPPPRSSAQPKARHESALCRFRDFSHGMWACQARICRRPPGSQDLAITTRWRLTGLRLLRPRVHVHDSSTKLPRPLSPAPAAHR